MSLVATAITLIACHGGPADHFLTFREHLIAEGYEVQVYASGPAIKKFQDRQIKVETFNVEDLSKEKDEAARIAKQCSKSSVVLTDVGHSFDIALHQALTEYAPKVLSVAYYDNPEPLVPGGYSEIAAKVMLAANRVIFANANLAKTSIYQEPSKEIDLPEKNRVGLGYYPVAQAEKTAKRRVESHDKMRADLFAKHELEDKGQKVLVYFGGNNTTYFEEAFPAFLRFLSEGAKQTDLSNVVIVMQQHPGAKKENTDLKKLEKWIAEQGINGLKIIISSESTDDIQVVADGALYYQTSMGPQFALAGIPMVQVGHKTYEDIVVRSKLCPSVTISSDFVNAITMIKPMVVSDEKREIIFDSLGIKSEWFQILKQALQK